MDVRRLTPNYTYKDIKELFESIKKNGYSLHEMSKLTGIRYATLLEWKSGKHIPGKTSQFCLMVLDEEFNDGNQYKKIKERTCI